jgi:hypothetical protein
MAISAVISRDQDLILGSSGYEFESGNRGLGSSAMVVTGVCLVKMPVMDGKTTPIAPSTSTIPIKHILGWEKSSTHLRPLSKSFSFGWAFFILSAIRKLYAINPCTIHKAVFRKTIHLIYLALNKWDRCGPHGSAPPTPPAMRVRIRWFVQINEAEFRIG